MANTDIFMFPEGNLDKSVSLQVHLPKQWDKIATGLTEVDQGKFYAPDFDVLYDSPLYLGNQKIIEFQELEKKDNPVYCYA